MSVDACVTWNLRQPNIACSRHMRANTQTHTHTTPLASRRAAAATWATTRRSRSVEAGAKPLIVRLIANTRVYAAAAVAFGCVCVCVSVCVMCAISRQVRVLYPSVCVCVSVFRTLTTATSAQNHHHPHECEWMLYAVCCTISKYYACSALRPPSGWVQSQQLRISIIWPNACDVFNSTFLVCVTLENTSALRTAASLWAHH